MTRPVVFPLGREALAWVRQGGKPTRAGRSQRFMHCWQSHWFERNLWLQSRLPPVPSLRADPLFVLGLWRSGTTYLHDLLSVCPGMLYPATWQCMSPASFRLQSPPARGKAVQRPMDGLTIDNLSPQEDEFALLALGVPSVYRGFFDPRRLPKLTQWLDPEAWACDRPVGWIDTWREFLTAVAEGHSGRLVLKSPNHSFRIHALAEAFPHAAYVWLVRDPLETFLSNRKMWLAMFERYALWAWDDSLLDQFLAQSFEFASTALGRATSLLPKERLAVVTFDQLTGETLPTMERLNSRLAIGNWSEMHPALARLATRNAGYRTDTYVGQELAQRALKAIDQLRSAQEYALTTHRL